MNVYCTIALVFFSGAQLWTASNADDCIAVTSGVDYSPGQNDLSNKLVKPDLAACCDACNKNAVCSAFIWLKTTKECFLKSKSTPVVLAPNSDIISGKKALASDTEKIDQCFQVNSGTDIAPGKNDILNTKGTTLGACCENCNSIPECKAFVWVKKDGQCFLKDADQPRPGNDAVISGKKGPVSLTQCSVVKNIDIAPGSHDILYKDQMSLPACCKLCETTANCIAYVWEKAIGRCYLKDVLTPKVENSRVYSGSPAGKEGTGCNVAGNKCSGFGDKTCCKDLSCARSTTAEFTCMKPPGCIPAGSTIPCDRSKENKEPGRCCSGKCYGPTCDESPVGGRCGEDKDCAGYSSRKKICVNYVCTSVSLVCSENGAACNPAVQGNNDKGACCYTKCRPDDVDPSKGVCTNDPPCIRTEGPICPTRYDAPCCTNLNLFCVQPSEAEMQAGKDDYKCRKSTQSCAVRTEACGKDGGNKKCCGDLRCEKPTSFEPTIYRCHEPPKKPICKSLGVNVQGYGGFACCSEHSDSQTTDACPFGKTCTSSTQYCACPQRQYTSCQNSRDCCGTVKCVDYRCT